jgi:ubiquinone/menaquinone biosynthesis C-methylase UbiE
MEQQHICPWWLGYTFILPFRKYQHDPQKILGSHIKPGMTVMDYGSAMGYFSIPLAKMTGEQGKVYCVDIQEKMLTKLESRAAKFDVEGIIKTFQVGIDYYPASLVITLDFILLFAVVHEVPDKQQLFNDLYKMSKSGCKVLFAEPKGHVKQADFEKSLKIAEEAGFIISEQKPMDKGLAAFLVKGK